MGSDFAPPALPAKPIPFHIPEGIAPDLAALGIDVKKSAACALALYRATVRGEFPHERARLPVLFACLDELLGHARERLTALEADVGEMRVVSGRPSVAFLGHCYASACGVLLAVAERIHALILQAEEDWIDPDGNYRSVHVGPGGIPDLLLHDMRPVARSLSRFVCPDLTAVVNEARWELAETSRRRPCGPAAPIDQAGGGLTGAEKKVLHTLRRATAPLLAKNIASITGLHLATVKRILKPNYPLRRLGFIVRLDGKNGGYQTPKVG